MAFSAFRMDVGNVKNLNVFLLGLAFLFVFTAFQTMSNVQTVSQHFTHSSH